MKHINNPTVKQVLFLLLLVTFLLVVVACSGTPSVEPPPAAAPVTYQINYEGLANATNPNPTSFAENEAAFELLAPTPQSAWYTFCGWYRDEALTTPCTAVDPAKEEESLTLYAKWEFASYTVSFYAQGELLHSALFDVHSETPTPPTCADLVGYTWAWPDFSLSPENMTVTAVYTPIPYTVTYENLQGGIANSVATYTTASETVLGTAERRGYTFLGWFDANDQKVESIPQGRIGDISLRAEWELATYTIVYENAKETDISAYKASYTIFDEGFDLDNDLHSCGYDFLGWFDENGQRVTRIEQGSAGDLVLTAKWEAITMHILYSNTIPSQKWDTSGYKQFYTLLDEPYELPVLEEDGYIFRGWANYFYPRQNVECLEPGATALIHCDNHNSDHWIHLQAQWEPITYTITYENTMGADLSDFKTSYTARDWSFDIPAIEVSGYDFLGWFDENDQKVERVELGSFGDLTLTAKWEPIVYTITYENTMGADLSGFKNTYTVFEEDYIIPSISTVGYTFVCWYDESGGQSTCIKKGSTGNITLSAHWVYTTYTITYENTMGADLSDFRKSYTIISDTYTLPSISLEGGTFHGWLLNGKPITEIPKGTYGDLVITADITPFAYQLVLESTYGDITEKEHTVYFGLPYTLPTLSVEGKVFLGWFENVSESAVAYTDGNGNSLTPYHKTTSRVLYARFAAQQCTVTYDTDGGNVIPAATVDWGSAFDGSALPTKEGAIFGGWYSVNLSTKYTNATIIHGDITVKAKWITATPISTADEFKAIASKPSGSYYLVNDINLGGAVWSPIGTFSGFLDGNGYTVKNFSVSTATPSAAFGFFSNNTGTIQNLVLEDFTFNVTAAQEKDINLGVMVGYNTGKMYHCVLKSGSVQIVYTREMTGDMRVGGLVGRNDGTLSGCKSFVNITSTQKGDYTGSGGMSSDDEYTYSKFGGLVGHNYGLIENCAVEATLSYSSSSSGHRKAHLHVHSNAGGLVGEQAENGKIANCYTNVTFTAATSNIYPSNDDHKEYSNSYLKMGGLVGANKGTVSDSYTLGTVKGGYANAVYVGGLVGVNASSGKIANCYSRANPSSTVSASVGGFVGENSATVQNSFAAGLVEGYGVLGGFAGRNETAGTISKCYSTASVKASSGTVGFFAGVQRGVVLKCYFMNGAVLMLGGDYGNRETEHGSILRVEPEVLWSELFLKETLYWDDEGWIILHSEDPILEWELAIDHDYEQTVVEAGCDTVGYTVYTCRDCNRFFVRDIVVPHGHEKTNFITVLPTCTAQGYNSYYCRRCECTVTEDVVLPTGHSKGVLVGHLDASCTEDGYDIYTCDACRVEGGVRYVIPATGHAPETIDATPSTCERAGKTEEIFCTTCGDVLKESSVIPPHDLEITVLEDADCESEGLCTGSCRNCGYTEESVVLPAYGHADINRDYRCDRCGVLSGTYDEADVVEITSVVELKAIIKNMNGVYRLMADLVLPADWACIGSEQKPFTGYFDGNGHTITFTAYSATVTARGVFAYNKGIITALNVVGCALLSSSENCTYGFVAVQNAGYVTDCHLGGSVQIKVGNYTSSAAYATLTQSMHAVFGGIVGINTTTGRINGCSADAKISIDFENTAECLADWSWLDLIRKGNYKKTHVTSMLVLTFGAIVGENSGTVEGCEVQSAITCNGDLPETSVDECYGFATAITTFHCGTVAGTGNELGTVRDCEFGGSLTFNSAGESTHGNKDFIFFGSSYDYKLSVYE